MNWGRLAAQNYRGVELPRVLGLALMSLALIGTLILAITYAAVGSPGIAAAGWGALMGSFLVFAAGLVDDLVSIGPRGIANHLRSLVEGQMTTGILKMIVIIACSIVVVALQPTHAGWTRVAGAVLVAACANVWNGLDVAPGRAVKAFLVVALFLVGSVQWRLLPTIAPLFLGGLIALVPDLRERAMLGDGGANLLGFTIGVGLYLTLPRGGVWGVAALAVTLNAASDTITLSRLIDRTPPLRWFDRLGRLHPRD